MANIRQAIMQLQRERTRLTSQLEMINGALSALKGANAGGKPRGGRSLSAAARMRIAAAQKARWAKWRKAHKKH